MIATHAASNCSHDLMLEGVLKFVLERVWTFVFFELCLSCARSEISKLSENDSLSFSDNYCESNFTRNNTNRIWVSPRDFPNLIVEVCR